MSIQRIMFLAVFLAYLILYILSPEVRGAEIQTLGLISSVGAPLIALYASRIYDFKSANGRAIILIVAGLVCWGIGEIVFVVLQNFIMSEELYPSLADPFFLIAYPLIAAGIYQGFVTAEVKIKQVKKSLIAVILLASLILTALVVYFMIYQAYDPTTNPLANIVNICYGLGDLVFVISSVILILVAREYGDGKLALFWKTLAIGFFLILVADIWFAVYNEQVLGDMKPFTYVDLVWCAGYELLALAMLENYLHIRSVQRNIKLKIQ